MKRILRGLALSLAVLLCLAGCAAAPQEEGSTAAPGGDQGPVDYDGILAGLTPVAEPGLDSFSTVDLAGNVVTQDIFKDHKVTLVNVWATYCDPCLDEMPGLGELAKEYESQGVQVIGIVLDVQTAQGTVSSEAIETVQGIITSTGADYRHLLPSEDLITGLLYKIPSIPETFFVDSTGQVIGEETYTGSKEKAQWAQIIQEKLAQIGS